MASAAQPASVKSESGRTNFGGSVVDGNRIGMVGVGSWFQTQDNTPTTALISPLTVSMSTVQHLIVPPNATYLTIIPKTNNVQVSEISGSSSLSQAAEVPSGTSMTFPVARQNDVYLLGVTGSSVVSFFFTTV